MLKQRRLNKPLFFLDLNIVAAYRSNGRVARRCRRYRNQRSCAEANKWWLKELSNVRCLIVIFFFFFRVYSPILQYYYTIFQDLLSTILLQIYSPYFMRVPIGKRASRRRRLSSQKELREGRKLAGYF